MKVVDGFPEAKSVDYVNSITLSSSIYVFYALNEVVEGTSFYQRIGRRIRMESLDLNMWIHSENFPTDPLILNWFIVYDRQNNGAAITYATMFRMYAESGISASGVFDFDNPVYSKRFTVLHQDLLLIGRPSKSAVVKTTTEINSWSKLNVHLHLSLYGLPAEFEAGYASYPATGALIIGFNCSSAIFTNPVTIDYVARLRYRDT